MPRMITALAVILFLVPDALPAGADGRIGVVLMHGKQSAPGEHAPLAGAIEAAGHPVERPEMCWSARRIYDRPYLECLRDISSSIDRLKTRGASEFVIAGHSLGANAALAYGATAPGLKGIVALAPGHRPEVLARRAPVIESLKRAGQLVAEGRGNAASSFSDFNGDFLITVTATPVAYLSFMDPDSPAAMPPNAARLTAPLLYLIGNADPIQRGEEEIFAKAPRHALNRYLTVRAGHFDTSAASSDAVISWLGALAKR
jgi:pimeloyl-ACP methyl ester carboxylesterase